MVAALVDEPARKCPDGIAAESAPMDGRSEEQVDVRVLELVLAGLRELGQSDQFAFVLDGEGGGVIAALCFVEQMLRRDLAPPACNFGFGADLRQALDVALFEPPQTYSVALQICHDAIIGA